jgi:hypothetical protein
LAIRGWRKERAKQHKNKIPQIFLFFMFFLLLISPTICFCDDSDGTASVASAGESGFANVTVPKMFTASLQPIISPIPTLLQFLEKHVFVSVKVTVENLMQKPQNLTVTWFVAEYGESNVLVNGTESVLVSYPTNTTVTKTIVFQVSLLGAIPDLSRAYTFNLEIFYLGGSHQLATTWKINLTLVNQQSLILILVIVIVVVVAIAIIVMRKNKPVQED